jgi:CRP/FNR family transcriptional regulator
VSGRGLVLYRVGPGESCTVTMSCLISNSPYPATGVVETELQAVVVPKAAFNRQMERSRVFRNFVLEIFSARVVHLMELINQVAFNKLDQRLAGRLLELGPVITMSHQELAEELGTKREIVSRILESLADEGAVLLGRRRIEVTRSELLLG